MISVERREQIRRAYFVDDKSIRKIAKELRCSRNTVKKAIASPEGEPYTLTSPRSAPVLGSYTKQIDELLAESEQMPRKQRYTGHKIYELIQTEGYTGSESGVRRYIGQRRREKRRPKVYLPLEFDPGTDGQVDWGEAVAVIAGERVTVQVFVMRLNYSRKLFVRAYPTQKQECFLDGSTFSVASRTGSATIISRQRSSGFWKDGIAKNSEPSLSFAATTCSRATSAHLARETRKGVWKVASGLAVATSWFRFLVLTRSPNSMNSC